MPAFSGYRLRTNETLPIWSAGAIGRGGGSALHIAFATHFPRRWCWLRIRAGYATFNIRFRMLNAGRRTQ